MRGRGASPRIRVAVDCGIGQVVHVVTDHLAQWPTVDRFECSQRIVVPLGRVPSREDLLRSPALAGDPVVLALEWAHTSLLLGVNRHDRTTVSPPGPAPLHAQTHIDVAKRLETERVEQRLPDTS